MKRIYACILIVAALLGVSLYSSGRVQGFAQDISADLDCALEAVRLKDFPTARQEAAKAALDALGCAYRVGSVATGDWFATDTPRSHWIADTFHPLLCEMEGCAVAQVCLRNGVKFMAIKSVSDCLFEHHDFAFNFPAAMKDLNRVVMAFLTQLTKE